MRPLLIEICGIKDQHLAKLAARAGANMLGLVFHPSSKRFVEIETAKKIVAAIKETAATPVAVFVDHTATEMQAICEAAEISCVQLHGDRARSEHHLLPPHYQRIYVMPVKDRIMKEEVGLHHCNPARDFILFDHHQAGSGKTFDWDNFNYHGPFRWLLAGGLTSANVKAAVNHLKPNGVDVSTGVENTQGEKDIAIIQTFIRKVHDCY